jgi:hypothetical protein
MQEQKFIATLFNKKQFNNTAIPPFNNATIKQLKK